MRFPERAQGIVPDDCSFFLVFQADIIAEGGISNERLVPALSMILLAGAMAAYNVITPAPAPTVCGKQTQHKLLPTPSDDNQHGRFWLARRDLARL